MRILALLEIREGWKFETEHVPGILNRATGGLSRWDQEVQPNLSAICPDISWQELPLPPQGTDGAVLWSIGIELVRRAVVKSSQRTYEGAFWILNSAHTAPE